MKFLSLHDFGWPYFLFSGRIHLDLAQEGILYLPVLYQLFESVYWHLSSGKTQVLSFEKSRPCMTEIQLFGSTGSVSVMSHASKSVI